MTLSGPRVLTAIAMIVVISAAGVVTARWWTLALTLPGIGFILALVWNDDWYSRVPEDWQAAVATGSVGGLLGGALGVVARKAGENLEQRSRR